MFKITKKLFITNSKNLFSMSSNNHLIKSFKIPKTAINSIYNYNLAYFTRTTNLKNNNEGLNKQETINKENEKLLFEFEDMLEKKEENPEKRIKLLSIKLLQASSSQEIINLFEEKYLKSLIEKIHAEELCLFYYFFVSHLEKEPNLNIQENGFKDTRLDTLVKKICEQLNEMDLTNIFVLSWSSSLLISKFKYNIPIELKIGILQKLPDELEIDKKSEIPTICFGISSFFNKNDTAGYV